MPERLAASPSDKSWSAEQDVSDVAITLHAGPRDAVMQCYRPGMILRQSAAVCMHNAALQQQMAGSNWSPRRADRIGQANADHFSQLSSSRAYRTAIVVGRNGVTIGEIDRA